MAKGLRGKKSKTKIALFEPLTQVEIIAYQKENKTIHNLNEIRISYPYQSIPFDVVKRTILFFLDELLIKTLKEETPDKALFDWLTQTLTWFDLSDESPHNFHLAFMMQLTRILGFYPKKASTSNHSYFNLESGLFTTSMPLSPNHISGEIAGLFNILHESSFEDAVKIQITSTQRRKLLETLILYYKLHFPGFGEIKSVEILKTILT
jgi:DNA repair protein RecO (recombination protein O)